LPALKTVLFRIHQDVRREKWKIPESVQEALRDALGLSSTYKLAFDAV